MGLFLEFDKSLVEDRMSMEPNEMEKKTCHGVSERFGVVARPEPLR